MPSVRNLGWSAYLLCLALGSLYMADSSWKSVTQYRSTYALDRNFEAGPAIASDLVMVVLDGLRTDAVAGLASYGRLLLEGASGTMRVAVPSLSNPGRAAFGTGAWPEVNGVTNNSTFEPVPVQSLFSLADRRGLRSSAFGSGFWTRAFGGVVEHFTPEKSYSSYEVEELVDSQSEYCDEALKYLASSEAAIRVIDLWAGDEAGHTYGGASDAYRQVIAAVDGCLGRIAEQVGPSVTLVALSDHGHIHRRGKGGHGGLEPEVINAPFVLAGPGVRNASQIKAQIVDIAPTISALLGLPIPANSQGRVLWEALDVPVEHEADLRQLEQEQRAALEAHMPNRAESLRVQRSTRLPSSALVGCCVLAVFLGSIYRQGEHLKALCIAVACFVVAYFVLFVALGLGYSISSIVRQEFLYTFLAKDVVAAAAAYGVSVLVLFRLDGRHSEAAIRLAVWITSLAALVVVWTHFNHGLRMDNWMVEIGPAFQAYLHMVAIVGVVLGTFLVVAINRLIPSSGESAQ